MKPPKKWKLAIVIWVAIYPIITSIFFTLGDYLMRVPSLPLRTLCVTLIAVPLMVFVALPFVQKIFKNWLHR